MEIVSLIVQQLHAGVISLLAFAPIWLILLNPITYVWEVQKLLAIYKQFSWVRYNYCLQ